MKKLFRSFLALFCCCLLLPTPHVAAQDSALPSFLPESGIAIEENVIYLSSPETTVTAFQAMCDTRITVEGAKGAFAGTGMSAVTPDGSTYPIVLCGDLSGDGMITARDYLMLRQILLGATVPDAFCSLAAEALTGTLNANAYRMLRLFLLGSNDALYPTPEQPVSDVARVDITFDGTVNRDEYIPASIQITDRFGNVTQDDSDSQIKIRGNSTSSGAKKPYNIKFSSKQNVLGMGKAKKWALLANFYDKSLIRNKLAYDFASDLGLDYVSQCVFTDVYVNGVFQGNYLLTENVEAGSSRVDINTDGMEFLFEFEPWPQYSNPECIATPLYGILLGFNDPETPTEAQLDFLKDFLGKAEDALATKNLKNVEQYFDLDSFIDDYIVHELFKNVDVATSSTRFYLKEDKLFAGPAWDFDLSSGNCSSVYYASYNNVSTSGDSTEGLWCRKLWWKYLYRCDGFAERVRERFASLSPVIENLYTENSYGESRITVLTTRYAESFATNFGSDGWDIRAVNSELERIPDSTYEQNVAYLRTWLQKRHAWLQKNL